MELERDEDDRPDDAHEHDHRYAEHGVNQGLDVLGEGALGVRVVSGLSVLPSMNAHTMAPNMTPTMTLTRVPKMMSRELALHSWRSPRTWWPEGWAAQWSSWRSPDDRGESAFGGAGIVTLGGVLDGRGPSARP